MVKRLDERNFELMANLWLYQKLAKIYASHDFVICFLLLLLLLFLLGQRKWAKELDVRGNKKAPKND